MEWHFRMVFLQSKLPPLKSAEFCMRKSLIPKAWLFCQAMLEIARQRAFTMGLKIALKVMDGEALDFPDRHFDTVVSTLTLCTFPDPVAALREMARVCNAEGRILLLEHGRSDREWLGRWQDRRADRHAEKLGCHWNRKPLELIHQAELKFLSIRSTFFGVIHEIEATPTRTTAADVLQTHKPDDGCSC